MAGATHVMLPTLSKIYHSQCRVEDMLRLGTLLQCPKCGIEVASLRSKAKQFIKLVLTVVLLDCNAEHMISDLWIIGQADDLRPLAALSMGRTWSRIEFISKVRRQVTEGS